jgi:peroxiredoxin
MNRFVVSLLALAALVATLALAQDAPKSIGLGASIPSDKVEMKNVDGKMLTIDSVKGAKGTLVIFTCNHCPYVKAWEKRITELGNAFSKQGIGVIAINSNDPARSEEDDFDGMVTRARDLGLQFPYVVDEGSIVAKAFGASKTPEAFLFDARGKLVYHGTIDDNVKEADKVEKRYLKDALTAVAAGQTPTVQETKALGCGIKFKES